jgi:hypothetical protein
MTTQAPILLFGSYGELDVYASVSDAERTIDPWTLADGQLSAADAAAASCACSRSATACA